MNVAHVGPSGLVVRIGDLCPRPDGRGYYIPALRALADPLRGLNRVAIAPGSDLVALSQRKTGTSVRCLNGYPRPTERCCPTESVDG
jgi:hypothetical protein